MEQQEDIQQLNRNNRQKLILESTKRPLEQLQQLRMPDTVGEEFLPRREESWLISFSMDFFMFWNEFLFSPILTVTLLGFFENQKIPVGEIEGGVLPFTARMD